MKQKKLFVFLGTTAEFIKLAPVVKELKTKKVPFTIIASGQNHIVFDEFKPYLGDLDVVYAVKTKTNKSSILLFAAWAIRAFFALMIGMRTIFRSAGNDSYVIVHGDTVSSLLGAVVAKLYGIKLVHIEAGLRSFDFFEPFPEEICRVIVSRLADIHFCPNEWAMNNLPKHYLKVNTYQNTLIDMFQYAKKSPIQNLEVKKILNEKTPYFILAVHRQEHVLFKKEETKQMLTEIFTHVPKGIRVLLLVHDLSASFINSMKYNNTLMPNIVLLQRMPYVDFMHLLMNSEFMITDGGSNQEELYYMGKPCLLLRNKTERIEGLNANVVLSKGDVSKMKDFLKHPSSFKIAPLRKTYNPSKIIVENLYNF